MVQNLIPPKFKQVNQNQIKNILENALQKRNININDIANEECLNCHSQYFERATKIKRISKILVPEIPNDQNAFLEVFICKNCGKEYNPNERAQIKQ